ncbi:VOC family protein [Gordonia soli]|uniref:VOC domain-containing protein n=1 Tax=Gordonia soli NBRC 108243 TaxID=1223545 RepID=M0QQH6_9ACTN|nr:VOC family protein [Gordonia soli]GAC69702.1 hypothetical protein GS4_26_01500 [Gordonia soli NBRC 108243]
MTISPVMITVDTADSSTLGRWWAEQTGGSVVHDDGGFCVVVVADSPRLAFQQVAEPTAGKNRIHLDLTAPDLTAEVARLTSVGATVVDEHAMEGFRWVTLADPDGNQFCVSEAQVEAEFFG